MASADYLDEEYFQIQDILSALTDSLPKVDPDSISNTHELVSLLIDQNKAYGKKIISLFETLETLYQSANPLEGSPGLASPDFNSKLHRKIQDYEELVKKLTAENEDFSTQIKQLSYQIESLKFQNQAQGSTTSEKKSAISTMSPSPIPKGTRGSVASKEVSLELENLFANAEYKRGVELLGQIDYKKPYNVTPEKFNTWLIISNRMKDASFNEILNKLKILLTFAEKDDEEEDNGSGLDDSLDRPAKTVAEKIYIVLDEKIPKIILKHEYKLETEKMKERGEFNAADLGTLRSTGRLQDSMELLDEDTQLTNEQLRLKVRYLNERVEQLERSRFDSQLQMRTMGSYEGQGDLVRKNEELLKDLQAEVETRLKIESQAREVVKEYEDLKDRYEALLQDVAEYDNKCQNLSEQLKENGDFVERLMQENTHLKEQYEFSEKLEDLEKMKELLQDKEYKIRNLTEELNLLKEYQKTPRESYNESKKYINDTPAEGYRGTKDFKTQLVIENALHIQGNVINNFKQTINDLKAALIDTLSNIYKNQSMTLLGNLGLDLPTRQTVAPINDDLDNPTTEAQRLLKNNHSVLRDVLSELNFVRGAVLTINGDVKDSNYQSLVEKHHSFTKRVTQAEEKLFDNLSNSIQTVSELISLLNDSQISGHGSQIHSLLLSLHTNITRTIQEYPDFSSELGIPRTQARETSSPSKRMGPSFKDKLVKDQSDLKTKLRSTLQNLESYQANEIYSKLCQEIDRNQELQELVEAKNVTIHKLNLLLNEAIDRCNRSLEQLLKIADSDEAQGLLGFIAEEISMLRGKTRDVIEANKNSGWRLDEVIEKAQQEFETQKEIWKKTMKEKSESDEMKIEQLIREIEGERKAHDITQKKLFQAQKEIAQSDKVNRVREELMGEIELLKRQLRDKDLDFKDKDRELDALKKELKELERERGSVLNQVEKLKEEMVQVGREKGRLRDDLVRNGTEKEEIRRNLDQISNEVEILKKTIAQKNGEVEQFRREVIELNRENDELSLKMDELANENQELKKTVEKLKSENKSLGQQVSEAFENNIEPMRRQIDTLQRENDELRDYKVSTESLFKKTNEQVDQLKISYFSDVNNMKEENKNLANQKKQLTADLERKTQEVTKLNQMLDSLQEFSNKQLETLKEREEKLNMLSSQKREIDQYVRELERKAEDLSDKNKRYMESISQNTADVQALKDEVHQLMEKQVALQRDLVLSKQRNEELAHQNQTLLDSREGFASTKGVLEDKVRKMNEILQITKNELKNSRELLEEKNRDIAIKDQEILELRDQMRRERENLSQADLVARLKKELQIKNDELGEIRRDYKKSLERNEKLNIEIETLRVTNRMSDQQIREVDKMNDLNRNMAIEVETLRKSVKQRDEQFFMEKENYERELQLTRKKVSDLQAILESKEQQLKAVPKSFNDSFKSSGSNTAGNSSYYSSLIESKDLEIKRLTQIVKNLTENLRDTQESKYKLKK